MAYNASARTAVLFAALLGLALLIGCSGSTPTPSTEAPGTTDGQTLVAEKCGTCHAIEQVNGAKKDRAGWTSTIARMRQNGADLTDEQAAAVVDYLTTRDGGQ